METNLIQKCGKLNFNNPIIQINSNINYLQNFSSEIPKQPKILNNNFITQTNNNQNFLHKNKFFKDIKLYNPKNRNNSKDNKRNNNSKQRNNSFNSMKNFSNTTQNYSHSKDENTNVNINQKRLDTILHTHTNIKTEQNITNTAPKMKNNYCLFMNKSNSFKSLNKSISNYGFIQQPKYLLHIRNKSANKSINNSKGKKNSSNFLHVKYFFHKSQVN